ncbi:MAG: N-acetylneuraminate synthase [Thermodesulfovibrio sp.]|nr:N-acetylneuraminate synthase [Thermodesulfovibrio sp.]MDW7998299.1 N-acetylneuraminate synthase [Thermodesulfovibrio sp.]
METSNRVFIIAEAGVNHNGSIENAKKLVDIAVEAGADAVKFQTYKAKNLVTHDADLTEYQRKNLGIKKSQYDMLRELELSYKDFEKLKLYCDKLKIIFMSTPFDIESARFLRDLGMDIFKIASGEITNYPLLREVGGYGKNVILSSGMSDLGEIEDALDLLIEFGTKRDKITVLHCLSQYPAPYNEVNLLAMQTIKEAFKIRVGYSDHTPGIEIAIAATAMGAKVIEKHFTVDRNLPGPDHKASLEPDELRKMIEAIRNVEMAMGDGIKRIAKSEIKNITLVRKSIVAKKNIKKGDILNEENITTKRPAMGINPMRWNEVIGKVAKRDFKEGELIEL